jgi:short-subunit dehydrogenase
LSDLFSNIAASGNGKVVLIGSTSGLENEGARLVVYTATKFAMRGAAHALRKLFRPVGVPVPGPWRRTSHLMLVEKQLLRDARNFSERRFQQT